MDEFEDPNPLPPVEDELAELGDEVGTGDLPVVPPAEPLPLAEPLAPPVLPDAEVADLAVEEEAPPADDPAEDPVDPPGDGDRLGEAVFPLAVYVPEDLPGDPPGDDLRVDDEVLVPSSVSVEVLDPQVVTDLGGIGLGFRLTRSDLVPTPGVVTGDAVYDGFRHAYGADLALRLRLVSLPGCVLTTPEEPGCESRTVVDTQNLFTEGVLRGVMEVAPDPGGGGRLSDEDGGAVFVVESDADGPTGDFGVTPVAPNGRWEVGLGSGAFSWSEPMPTVPLPTGGAGSGPGLSYSSQAVDGRVSASNNQASWAGLGWELSSGFITRAYQSCADAGHPTWGDYCWHSENASITLNGVTSELVALPGGGTEWRLRDDPGWRVMDVADPDGGGQYWRVITPDGTNYFFGASDPSSPASGQLDTESKLGARVYGAPSWAGSGCGAASLCPTPWRWNLSHVVDASGNATVYTYEKEHNYYKSVAAGSDQTYNRHGYLAHVYHGLRMSVDSASPEMSGVDLADAWSRLDYAVRWRCQGAVSGPPELDPVCPQGPEAVPAQYPDVPVDLMCTDAEICTKVYPSFFTTKRLSAVKAWVKQVAGTWVLTDTVQLGHLFPETGDGTDPHLWLQQIETVGQAPGESISLPVTEFGGANLPNRVDPNPGAPLMHMHRVDEVYTSAGGAIAITYGRPDPCNPADTPHPATNTSNCFPVKLPADHHDPDGFGWFHNYVTTQVVPAALGSRPPIG